MKEFFENLGEQSYGALWLALCVYIILMIIGNILKSIYKNK